MQLEIDDIQAAGLDRAKVEDLVDRAQREVDEGRLPSCQLALARNGVVGAVTTIGAPATSRYVIFSATKAIVATAMWIVLDEGAVKIDETVAHYIPEFGANGKDAITVEQVMLHTSGFPRAPLGPPRWDTREGRLEAFARWRLNWEPGTHYEYHPTSAHWVLAELIERTSGVPYTSFVAERVLAPIGLERFQLGVPLDEQADICELEKVGELVSADELEKAIGIRSLPVTDVTAEALLQFNRPEARALGVPGGGGVSNATDLACFYQALLAGSPPLLSANALYEFTVHVRNHLKDYMGTSANRTLGLVVAGDDGRSQLRGMGRTVSPRAFGHNGAGGQIAFADPDTGISFVFLTNGLEQNILVEGRRTTAIASRAAACAAT
ncbi:MAG TPA: serine hydrolase domain-containing protein [Acidimicrobiia bacterium]|jgi:CubicO group peptidase (beta-lactamase class C family)